MRAVFVIIHTHFMPMVIPHADLMSYSALSPPGRTPIPHHAPAHPSQRKVLHLIRTHRLVVQCAMMFGWEELTSHAAYVHDSQRCHAALLQHLGFRCTYSVFVIERVCLAT